MCEHKQFFEKKRSLANKGDLLTIISSLNGL